MDFGMRIPHYLDAQAKIEFLGSRTLIYDTMYCWILPEDLTFLFHKKTALGGIEICIQKSSQTVCFFSVPSWEDFFTPLLKSLRSGDSTKEKRRTLKHRMGALEKEMLQLKFAPGGEEYRKAKEDFEEKAVSFS